MRADLRSRRIGRERGHDRAGPVGVGGRTARFAGIGPVRGQRPGVAGIGPVHGARPRVRDCIGPVPGARPGHSRRGQTGRQPRRPLDLPADERFDEDVDRAPAGQANVPRLLVADPVPDDARAPVRSCPPDLVRRGTLHAPAADGSRDAAVRGKQQHGALGTWRRPERADDHGAPDFQLLGAPRRERLDELLHAIASPAASQGWPAARRAGRPRCPDSSAARCFQAGQRARRDELVDRGKRGGHASGERLVSGGAGQRIEPDQAMARAPQTGHLEADHGRVAPVPPVADHHHDRAAPEHPPCPAPVEFAQAIPDARPARPVGRRLRHPREGAIPVAVVEQPRDAGQPGPEHEGLGADGGCRERLGKSQEQPGVPLHGARDVAQDHQGARPADPALPDPLHGVAAGLEVAPEHRPGREHAAPRVQLATSRAPQLEAGGEQVDEALRLPQLGARHPVELSVPVEPVVAPRLRRDHEHLEFAGPWSIRLASFAFRSASRPLPTLPPHPARARPGGASTGSLSSMSVAGATAGPPVVRDAGRQNRANTAS